MIEIILVAVIILQTILHSVERRDMYNRLMSKSLTEYKRSGTPPEHIPSAHERVLNKWKRKAGE